MRLENRGIDTNSQISKFSFIFHFRFRKDYIFTLYFMLRVGIAPTYVHWVGLLTLLEVCIGLLLIPAFSSCKWSTNSIYMQANSTCITQVKDLIGFLRSPESLLQLVFVIIHGIVRRVNNFTFLTSLWKLLKANS